MGFGGLFQKQNDLTSLSNNLSVQAGKQQQTAANTQAADLRAQGDVAYQQAEENKALFARENTITAGQEAEQYLSSGVYLQGTPMAVINETRRLGAFKENAMEQQGILQQDLLNSQADQAENIGLQDYLQGTEGADINSMNNTINQDTTENNFYRSLFTGAASGGLSILGKLIP